MSSDHLDPIDQQKPIPGLPDPAEGWQPAPFKSGFMGLIGPYFVREGDNNAYEMGFVAGPQHLNGGGSVHGGCLLTLADTALFMFARPLLTDIWVVTVQLESQFISPGREGEFIYATGEVTQNTQSMIFARGQVKSKDRVILSFSGILKKKKPPVLKSDA